MKLYLHNTHNESGDRYASFPLSLLAYQVGLNEYSPESYTTLSSFPKAVHDAWTGLIAEGEEVICYRHTLNNLQTIIRELANIVITIVPQIEKGQEARTNKLTKFTYHIHYMSTGVKVLWNSQHKDYNKVLESGLFHVLDNIIF